MKTVSNSDADRNLFNGTMKNWKKKIIYALIISIYLLDCYKNACYKSVSSILLSQSIPGFQCTSLQFALFQQDNSFLCHFQDISAITMESSLNH